MKRTPPLIAITLIIAAIVQAPLLSAAAPAEVSVSGEQFVDLLVKEDFPAAVAQFDSTMKNVLPEAKLKETWQSLKAQAGTFQKRVGATASKLAGYDVVLVTCQFERTTLDAKVVFNSQKQIAGLFFVPSHAAAGASGPPPYAQTNSFHEKEFTVGSGPWQLPGTLTLPNTPGRPLPVLVLVHGSGPNDRDESVGANKPFRDLAWGLATKGIAVLRYEKRTREHAAKFMAAGLGKFTVQQETIDDALSAVAQLRALDGINPKRIFVLGHSLGGMVVPRIGRADRQITGLIILAGATRPLEDVIVEQTRYLLSLRGKPSAEDESKVAEIQSAAAKVKSLTAADAASSETLLGAPPAYWLDLRENDPLVAVKTLAQPLLILQGERDYQVTQVDFNRWKEALGDQPTVTYKLYPKLNHLFISGEAKSTPDEYEQPSHVAEAVIEDIAAWIRER